MANDAEVQTEQLDTAARVVSYVVRELMESTKKEGEHGDGPIFIGIHSGFYLISAQHNAFTLMSLDMSRLCSGVCGVG